MEAAKKPRKKAAPKKRNKVDRNAASPSKGSVAALPRTGRPSIRSDALAAEICERIAKGESLYTICASEGMPGYRTVMEWREDDATFAQRYLRARRDQADFLAEQILRIADEEPRHVCDAEGTTRVDPAWVTHQRNKVEARKWYASKLAPDSWGDKPPTTDVSVAVTTNVSVGKEMLTNLQERRAAALARMN